jgi:hypothetical protein
MRIRDIEAKIEEKFTFDRAKLPRKAAVKWAPRRTHFEATMLYSMTGEDLEQKRISAEQATEQRRDIMDSIQATTLQVGGAWPLRAGMTIVAIFSDDDVHRVYAVQTLEELNGGPSIPPTRYNCKRGVFDYDADVMHIDTFIDEIVNEWVGVEAGVSSAQQEQEIVVDYLRSLPPDYSVHQAATDIEQDVHHDGEEEEDEPEAPQSGPVPATVVEPPKPEATSS